MILAISAVSLAIWLYCVFLRGGFWRGNVIDGAASHAPSTWPHIVAVIPARNEQGVISASLTSLLQQDYPGRFSIVLVDDNSEDETASIAQALPGATGSSVPLDHDDFGSSRSKIINVIDSNSLEHDVVRKPLRTFRHHALGMLRGEPLPDNWTGKLWALHQGIAAASGDRPDFLLLTDADIVYESDVVGALASHSVAGGYVLNSLMAKLRCESFAERAFIPAFIYFFQMLYPFSWVNDPHRKIAAAAGGCMLLKADALARAGGIAAIRDALIDDCSLAKVMKAQGPIRLSLTERVHSIRPSLGVADIHATVSRSAYAQLRYSPILLALTLVGMGLTYWAPPLIAIFGLGTARLFALAAWVLMAVSFWPTLRFYGLSPFWSPALPAIATGYMAFTLSSALQHSLGQGGRWKGRYQAKKG